VFLIHEKISEVFGDIQFSAGDLGFELREKVPDHEYLPPPPTLPHSNYICVCPLCSVSFFLI
jgi:hypothetical protein